MIIAGTGMDRLFTRIAPRTPRVDIPNELKYPCLPVDMRIYSDTSDQRPWHNQLDTIAIGAGAEKKCWAYGGPDGVRKAEFVRHDRAVITGVPGNPSTAKWYLGAENACKVEPLRRLIFVSGDYAFHFPFLFSSQNVLSSTVVSGFLTKPAHFYSGFAADSAAKECKTAINKASCCVVFHDPSTTFLTSSFALP